MKLCLYICTVIQLYRCDFGNFAQYDFMATKKEVVSLIPDPALGAQMEICTPIYSNYLHKTGDMRYNPPMTLDFDIDVKDTVLPAGN